MHTQMEALLSAMISYETGSPKRAQHLIKVYTFSKLIGLGEDLDPRTLFILEAAAAVHIVFSNTQKLLTHFIHAFSHLIYTSKIA